MKNVTRAEIKIGITADSKIYSIPKYLSADFNVGPEPVTLTLHEPLYSVEFARLEEDAEFPYSGPYQDQDDFPADQYNYILSARTTSLAEIPTFRKDIRRLNALIEEGQTKERLKEALSTMNIDYPDIKPHENQLDLKNSYWYQ